VSGCTFVAVARIFLSVTIIFLFSNY
jgi:hypothetical protein